MAGPHASTILKEREEWAINRKDQDTGSRETRPGTLIAKPVFSS